MRVDVASDRHQILVVAAQEIMSRIHPSESERGRAGRQTGAHTIAAMSEFAKRVIAWQRRHGRHDLPWQGTRDPYRVWLSEVMLQQTQVSTVIPYYRRFLERYPDVEALAAADEGRVLQLWSGLGYYARARNLLRAARVVAQRGGFPATANDLAELPGLGRSSAAAIAVFAFGERAAILDGNVKRVLARAFAVEGYPGDAPVMAKLWELADSLLPARAVESYTQGLMDLGATVCTRTKPRCADCPLADSCAARREGRVAELPASRGARPVPHRDVRWLVAMQQDRVMLERRPSTGLWGGLLAFPEIVGHADAFCAARTGLRPEAPLPLPDVEHAFTHFTLRATPVLCRIDSDARIVAEPGAPAPAWLTIPEAMAEAVPAPVRRVLAALSGPADSRPAKPRRASAAPRRNRAPKATA
jgi:A/G-specific adenine glycosylase